MENENQTPEAVKKGAGVGKFFLFGFLGLLALLLVAGAVFTYSQTKKLSENSTVLMAAKLLSIPAAKINGLEVSYGAYIEDLQTLRKFYENPPQGITKPDDEVMSDQVLSRLVANKLIESLAKKYGAKVTDEDRDKFKTDLLAQFTDENDAREKINTYYGWTLEKYLDKVGGPILLEQKLQEAIKTQQDFFDNKYAEPEVHARHILFAVKDKSEEAKMKKQAEEVLQKIKDGADFAEMAKQYGSDSTKDMGGDLDWFGRGQMVPEFEEAAFKLEAGQLSEEPVRSQYGFHIIKVDEKRMSQNFIAFMNDQFKDADIEVFLPIHNPFTQIQESLNNNDGDQSLQ